MRQWRVTRHLFVPAPHISLGEYRGMSPRQRQLHDLYRAATHANLPLQDTPMSIELAKVMGARLQNNALKRRPTTRAGLMLTGGGYQGKTETACEIAAAFEDSWLDLRFRTGLGQRHIRGAQILASHDGQAQLRVASRPILTATDLDKPTLASPSPWPPTPSPGGTCRRTHRTDRC
ncbi:hypothetical protein AB0L63_24300 [Nocardia sp. NPDC051990]|uniref:hypothetical protein n=1 Tax=Nocardia sp. NPDC051990 TaxID=3155285 RepID=UPI00342A760B